MIELSKKVIDIAKELNVQKPIKENLNHMLENSIDIDNALGNKLSNGYIFNVVNDVVVDISIQVGGIKAIKCVSCKDEMTTTVYEVCERCNGIGYDIKTIDANTNAVCSVCKGTGDIKTLIPCQDCKTEK